ncbi:hypothetical protein Q5692_20760 [Microcoleus sp. C2C3]|uniref:hypothetical protein n=1 Tax=unclassified Microcoleus TaxID=2642155 RepID=UPI002FD57A91
MTEETKTYPLRLKTDYVPGTIIEFCHFRDISLEATEKTAIYLETVSLVLNLQNMRLGLIPNYDGDETEAEKLAKFNQAEDRSERFGIQFLTRKNNTGDWHEEVEIICINRGRKDYIDLLQPFFSKYSIRMLEVNDAFAIKLIDYGYGLIKLTDTLRVSFGLRIQVSKKNDTEALENRIAALELALKGRLIDLPANTLLGRNLNTGVVEIISQNTFAKPADIDTAIFNLIGGAPGALNTLDELAAALADDANFATTITNLLALKAPLANPSFTGFTTLGDNAAIKIKILFFTSPSTSNNTVLLNGQLPPVDKIVALTGWLKCADTDYYPPNFYSAAFLYTNWWSIYSWSNNLYLNLHPNAISKMGNQPGKIMVIYTA